MNVMIRVMHILEYQININNNFGKNILKFLMESYIISKNKLHLTNKLLIN